MNADSYILLHFIIVLPSMVIYFLDKPFIQNKCVVMDDLKTKMFSDSKL